MPSRKPKQATLGALPSAIDKVMAQRVLNKVLGPEFDENTDPHSHYQAIAVQALAQEVAAGGPLMAYRDEIRIAASEAMRTFLTLSPDNTAAVYAAQRALAAYVSVEDFIAKGQARIAETAMMQDAVAGELGVDAPDDEGDDADDEGEVGREDGGQFDGDGGFPE